MRKLFLILALAALPAFGQQHKQAMDMIQCGIDTSYFVEDGRRWFEFSLPVLRAYKVMDLCKADTTINFDVVEGHKEYMKYIKYNGLTRMKKYDRKVIGHLVGTTEDYYIVMWMFKDDAFGMLVSNNEG